MENINKKSINFGLKMLIILAFSLLALPIQTSAYSGRNVTYGSPEVIEEFPPIVTVEANNPRPVIFSINPDSGDRDLYGKTITITGKGFVPGSVARINGANRPTTFIDPGHLMLEASGADMYRADGGFYVTVWNGAPGGGFSNSVFFTVRDTPLPPADNDATQGSINSTSNRSETLSALTSNAVYGSGSFLPSGVIQWVLFAIVILLLVILARKFFGGEHAYHTAPLKHD